MRSKRPWLLYLLISSQAQRQDRRRPREPTHVLDNGVDQSAGISLCLGVTRPQCLGRVHSIRWRADSRPSARVGVATHPFLVLTDEW